MKRQELIRYIEEHVTIRNFLRWNFMNVIALYFKKDQFDKQKLGIPFWKYLDDRIHKKDKIPSLVERMK